MPLLRRFLESCWVAWVVFLLVSTMTAFLLSWGGLTRWVAVFSLLLGVATAVGSIRWVNLEDRHHDPVQDGHWFWRGAVWIAFALFGLRAFLWLVFQKGEYIAVLSRNNLGDLPLHIQYIRFFSQGATLWPDNPFHSGARMGYPFGVDYFNALLDVCGYPLWPALILTGLLGTAATAIALYRWGRAFGMAGFLFNGGAAGLVFFSTGVWQDYQQGVDWKSIPLALFVTQRGFLYALPAGLLLLVHWRRMHSRDERPAKSLPFWLEWLIYGTMPLFHLHTFLFLSVVLGWQALFGVRRARLWSLVGASFIPATWLIWWISNGFQAGGAVAWVPGWMQGKEFSFNYWVLNFGALPVFFVGLVYFLCRQRRSGLPVEKADAQSALRFLWPALLVFVATLFFKFSPWIWDNTKLMLWSYLVFLPWLWQTLVNHCNNSVRTVVCLLLFSSGFVSLWGGLGRTEVGYKLASLPDVLEIDAAIRYLPIQSVFASAPEYAHPLVFCGRRLAVGYHGHMVGHGVAYQAHKKLMDQFMTGDTDWENARRALGIDLVFWGKAEEQRWPVSEKPWAADPAIADLVAAGTWGEIYQFRPTPSPVNPAPGSQIPAQKSGR